MDAAFLGKICFCIARKILLDVFFELTLIAKSLPVKQDCLPIFIIYFRGSDFFSKIEVLRSELSFKKIYLYRFFGKKGMFISNIR